MKIIHVRRKLLDGVKWVVQRSVELNRLNIKKVKRDIGFMRSHVSLKLESHPPKKSAFFWFIESPLKMMNNAFYFI